ncbi:hypothetical protein ACFL20_06235 [Spirochaetota bacterium]
MFKKIYFVLCPPYHGATLIAKYLNAHPNVVSLGDAYPSNEYDQMCGCSSRVSKCSYWNSIKNNINAKKYEDEKSLLPLYNKITGTGLDNYLYHLIPGNFRKLITKKSLKEFHDCYVRFLEAVYEVEAKNRKMRPSIFVDGVKSISRVKALYDSGINISGIIHLFRNPYDYVKSSQKNNPNIYDTKLSIRIRSVRYNGTHRIIEKMGKNFPIYNLYYKDFVENNQLEFKNLLRFLDVEELPLQLNKEWHFMGNKSLLKFDGTLKVKKYEIDNDIYPIIYRWSSSKRFGY